MEKDNTRRKRSRKKSKRKRSQRSLFFRTMFISMAVCIIFISSAWIVKGMIIKEPEIPKLNLDAFPNLDDIAFLPPDGVVEDMHIGNGLQAPEGFTDEDRKDQFYTFLIVGLDEGINTDTIMVGSYDGINKEGCIISIPRDSLVNVKRTVKKINSAYPAGTLHGGGKEGGVEQLKKEVKTIIGFVPDFYVCINLDAFVKIVDAVGGIDVDVPLHMKYDDPIQDLHIDIPEGPQSLDGRDALRFARYRKGNNGKGIISDYQRIENQQAVIKGLLGKAMNPANLLKIPEFMEIFNENVYSDIEGKNMLWFADQLNGIRGTDALSTYTMPTTGTSGLPMYYEYLDEAGIVELVNKSINPYKKDIEAKDLDIIDHD